MKKLITEFQDKLYKVRSLVEINFRILKQFCGFITSLPKSVDGYLANYIYSLLAYQIFSCLFAKWLSLIAGKFQTLRWQADFGLVLFFKGKLHFVISESYSNAGNNRGRDYLYFGIIGIANKHFKPLDILLKTNVDDSRDRYAAP